MTTHLVVDNDLRNPHAGDNPDCTGTLCPACGCCMHCIPGTCGCTVPYDGQCTDPYCLCPAPEVEPPPVVVPPARMPNFQRGSEAGCYS